MGRREERKNGYIGEIVSGDKLAQIARQIYALQYLPNQISECTVEDMLLIELKEQTSWGENKYAIVCDEGVGFKQQDRYLITIPTNVGELGIYNGAVELSVDVIKSCLTGETKDIADFVRVFGDRLDNNVYIWQSEMKDPVNV